MAAETTRASELAQTVSPFRLAERLLEAERKLAGMRAVLVTSLTETGDELGVLERPTDDSAMLDRALRLINRLLAIIGTDKEDGNG